MFIRSCTKNLCTTGKLGETLDLTKPVKTSNTTDNVQHSNTFCRSVFRQYGDSVVANVGNRF